MKIVRLEQGKGLTITDEGYELITQLVSEHQICSQCTCRYTDTRPQVALNLCLPCFMGGYPQIQSYVGTAPLSDGRNMYLFLDRKGYVHYSTLNTTQLIQDTFETLRYWHYPVPLEYTRGDYTITLSEVYWSIDSEFVTTVNDTLEPKPIIIISYTHRAGDNRKIDYISYQNALAVLIDKRSKWIRSLFTDTKNLVEQTMKHPEGGYEIKGVHKYSYDIYDLYSVMGDILCERYNKSTQEEQA